MFRLKLGPPELADALPNRVQRAVGSLGYTWAGCVSNCMGRVAETVSMRSLREVFRGPSADLASGWSWDLQRPSAPLVQWRPAVPAQRIRVPPHRPSQRLALARKK